MNPYASDAAFRAALEQRLLNTARTTKVNLDRLRRQVVLERLLARLAAADPGVWVLKGAMALEVRLGTAARATMDASLAERGRIGSHRFMTYVAASDDVELPYLRHFLLTEAGLALLGHASPGSAGRNKTLAIDRFEALEIPLPSIDEQRSVASKLDVLCSRARKMEEQLQRENGDMWLTTFPALIDVMFARSAGTPAAVGDLVDIVSDVVHPGDDPGAATQFVGLQHVESHSGRCIGSDPIGNESGRKFRFMPGDIVYGYLRPYLNKVWLADRHGLCSVDQYVLRPRDGVDADLLSYALRSRSALDQAVQMTHSLQLPRLRSGLLASMVVPWLEGRGRLSIRSQLELVSRSLSAAVQLRRDQARIAKSLIPSMLNSAFAGLL